MHFENLTTYLFFEYAIKFPLPIAAFAIPYFALKMRDTRKTLSPVVKHVKFACGALALMVCIVFAGLVLWFLFVPYNEVWPQYIPDWWPKK